MQLICYLDALRPSQKRRGKIDVPVALVFTKADLCEEAIHDPEAFARANVPALVRLCETRLKHFWIDCSGVIGSTARLTDRGGLETLVPLRVEPRGIIETFA
jgi:hypothetical protein